MVCIGIDVTKDKYDRFILSSEGEVLADVFTIPQQRGRIHHVSTNHLRLTLPRSGAKKAR